MPRSAKAKAEMTQEELRLVEAREKGIPWRLSGGFGDRISASANGARSAKITARMATPGTWLIPLTQAFLDVVSEQWRA